MSQPQRDHSAANEAKRQAKMAKFVAKQEKLTAAAALNEATAKDKKKTPVPKTAPTDTTPGAAGHDDPPVSVQCSDPIVRASERLTLGMPECYLPRDVEAVWGDWWEAKGLFRPRDESKDIQTGENDVKDSTADRDRYFVVPIPPPNVTGSLHLGHALTVSIQDTLVRWNRMRGKIALYNPGCDHAGIATQSIVEKKLWKESGLTRHNLGREKFLEKIWEWKERYGARIYTQLRTLGTSCDWSRACFTMDKTFSRAVTEAFVRLHSDGIIYRATRLVNWCSHLNTALSNLEVDSRELTGRTLLALPGYDRKIEFGVMVYFSYKMEPEENVEPEMGRSNEACEIIVATTRVETMLGDTGIAVHPDDTRYSRFVGRRAIHPFVTGRYLLVVADKHVDPAFGTGAVKITPAHDANDFDISKRHSLPAINILNDDGTLNANAGADFAGLRRFDARYRVIEALKAHGHYRETKSHAMVVPICSRSGDIIEPRMKPQWWVRCQGMADTAMDVVRTGQLEILPRASEKEWFRWLENTHDWCISRQLWWGHRVPAYRVILKPEIKSQTTVESKVNNTEANPEVDAIWVSGRSEEDAREAATAQYPGREFTLEQDEDVLDTWFSSALWPFSIHGWPEKTIDFTRFYPASLLETGWDILFFWVARMVMLGIRLTGQVPFARVFCHAMVRDAHGRKMSKSLGNVVDPEDVIRGITLQRMQDRLGEGNLDPREIERASTGMRSDYPNGIPECGADALRFALLAYTSAGRDLNLDILRVEGYRKFGNKIWNAMRFAMRRLGQAVPEQKKQKRPVEHWILSRLDEAATSVSEHLAEMNFMAATTAVHAFWLYDLCDIFLESVKALGLDEGSDTLQVCVEGGLRLLHPFMPSITEELWQRLGRAGAEASASIMVSSYPTARPAVDEHAKLAAADFGDVLEVARMVRALARDYAVETEAKCELHVAGMSDHAAGILRDSIQVLRALVRGSVGISELKIGSSIGDGCGMATITGCNGETIAVGLQASGHMDIKQEIIRTSARLVRVRAQAEEIERQMAANGYEKNVPQDVQAATETKRMALLATAAHHEHLLATFERLKMV